MFNGYPLDVHVLSGMLQKTINCIQHVTTNCIQHVQIRHHAFLLRYHLACKHINNSKINVSTFIIL